MKTMEQQLMELANKHLDCELWACNDGCEVHIFDYNEICVKSYSWYCSGWDENEGEYRDSTEGLYEHKESILFAYADNHESMCLIRPEIYDKSKQVFVDALKNAHKAYWFWRSNFAVHNDIDFKELTDIAHLIDELIDKEV